jgi:cytochrome c553
MGGRRRNLLERGSVIVGACAAAFTFAGGVALAQEPAPKTPVEQYVELCGMCHRAGGMGTGLIARRLPAGQAELEQRGDLTADLVETVVRIGIGNMPRLSRAEVSDAALAAIAAYLADGPHDTGETP